MVIKVVYLILKILGIKKRYQLQDDDLYKQTYNNQIKPLIISKYLIKHYNMEEYHLNKHKYFKIDRNSNKTIIYIHGGGFINPITKYHWHFIKYLTKKTNDNIIVSIYPLAPHYNVNDVMNYFKELLALIDNEIILIGDSAGANIALSLIAQYPLRISKLVALSPFIRFNSNNKDIIEVNKKDPFLAIDSIPTIYRWYAKGVSDDHIYINSTNYLNDRMKIMIISSTLDITNPDTKLLVNKYCGIKYLEYEGLFHVFILFRFIKQARDARKQMINYLERND